MIGRLAKRMTIALIKQQQIDKGDSALYEYGFFILLSNLIFFALTCLTGALVGAFLQSVLFFIAFQFIRRYAGGYHASTELRCQFFSTVSIVVSILSIKLFQQYEQFLWWTVLMALGTAVIVFFSPLDTPAKPLSCNERKVYKKKTILILLVSDIAFTISVVLQWDFFYLPIAIAIGLETILLTLGKIQQCVKSKRA